MKRLLPLLMMFLTLALAGCFRDAGEDRQVSDSQDVQIFPTVTATAPNTNATDDVNADATAEASGEINAATPTLNPSPTPAQNSAATEAVEGEDSAATPISGNTFGDPGVSVNPAPPTQPAPEALITPTAFADGLPKCVHVVQANETLIRIAEIHFEVFQATVDGFIAANPEIAANPGALFIGQELIIPNCNPEDGTPLTVAPTPAEAIPNNTASQPAPTPGEDESSYTVQSGDTLSAISRRFNVSVEAIIAANPALAANPNSLQVGQVLVIPPSGQ